MLMLIKSNEQLISSFIDECIKNTKLNMSNMNFYERLNASTTATFDELKRNYKQLILQCHPDKLQQQQPHQQSEVTVNSAESDPNRESDNNFNAINEAWNILKDPIKRKLYDAELLQTKFETHSNIYATITLNDMQHFNLAGNGSVNLNPISRTGNTATIYNNPHNKTERPLSGKVAQKMASTGEIWLQWFSCCFQQQRSPSRRPHQRLRIDRSMIGNPTNFVHTGHIGSADVELSANRLNAISTQMQSKGGYETNSIHSLHAC
ncbi:hypothetical protein ACLKA6_019885 [Drosophila palustris]